MIIDIFLFIGVLFLGIYLGYNLQILQNKKDNTSNFLDIELIPANTNKEIAKLSDEAGTSDKMKLLKQIAEEINKAAEHGLTKLNIENDLNREIDKKLTKTDIHNYFTDNGYHVEFCYNSIPCPKIEFISWEEA